MKMCLMLITVLAFLSCNQNPSQPVPAKVDVIAYVHWDSQGLEGKRLELLETGTEKSTDSTGHAVFSVPPGKYTLRAFDINRGGPTAGSVDINVDATSGKSVTVDIMDCLPCV